MLEELGSEGHASDEHAFTRTKRSHYQCFVRPLTGRLLSCLRLDVEYVVAQGDALEYIDERGERIGVYDFLGGYGALMFGHNHPQLVASAIDLLRTNRPFAAQASLRGFTALLGHKLNAMLSARWHREFVTTLANSGAEAVEAALKHALLAHRQRRQGLLDASEKRLLKLRNNQMPDRLPVASESVRLLKELLEQKVATFAEAVQAVRRLNQQSFLEAGAYFCCLHHSYHGKTSGAVNLTENELYRADFASIGPQVIFVSRDDPADFRHQASIRTLRYYSVGLDAQRQAVVQAHEICNLAALFVEPIQGEGGVHVLDGGYLRQLRNICDDYEIHLIFDEIQSGMGRTGRFLACEASGVGADYYLLSKSLGGGLAKIASVSIARSCFEERFSLIHTSTFAEDDFSSAIALRSLQLLDEDASIMRACMQTGDEIKTVLLELKQRFPEVVADVRGEGLMLAMEFIDQGQAESPGLRALASSDIIGFVYAGYLLHEHRIRVAPLLSNNNVLRFEPAACVCLQARQQLYDGLERLCLILRSGNFYHLVKFIIGLATPHALAPVQDYRGRYFSTPAEGVERCVGFLMHFVDASNMRAFDLSCEHFSLAQIEELLERCYKYLKPFYMRAQTFYSKTGKRVRLQSIGLPITSALIQKHVQERDNDMLVALINTAIDKAVGEGCQIVGFGGFTSILMQNCKAVQHDALGVTTGNALTIGMGYQALLKRVAETGIDLSCACFAAVGANGNIGAVYSELMAEKVASLILIGRPGRERALEALAEKIYTSAFRVLSDHLANGGHVAADALASTHALAARIADTHTAQQLLHELPVADEQLGRRLHVGLQQELGESSPIRLSTDPAAIGQANLVLGASSHAGSLIFAEHLQDGPVIICDVALPADTDPSLPERRPDVTVIKGGLVRVPPVPAQVAHLNAHTGARDFLLEGLPLPPDHVFACMAEAILMGLTGITSDYSKGDVRKEQVMEMLELAKLHGFELGDLKMGRSY